MRRYLGSVGSCCDSGGRIVTSEKFIVSVISYLFVCVCVIRCDLRYIDMIKVLGLCITLFVCCYR